VVSLKEVFIPTDNDRLVEFEFVGYCGKVSGIILRGESIV